MLLHTLFDFLLHSNGASTSFLDAKSGKETKRGSSVSQHDDLTNNVSVGSMWKTELQSFYSEGAVPPPLRLGEKEVLRCRSVHFTSPDVLEAFAYKLSV